MIYIFIKLKIKLDKFLYLIKNILFISLYLSFFLKKDHKSYQSDFIVYTKFFCQVCIIPPLLYTEKSSKYH